MGEIDTSLSLWLPHKLLELLSRHNPRAEFFFCSECGRKVMFFIPHVNESGKTLGRTCLRCFRENYEE